MTRTNTGKSRVSGILRTPGTVGFRIGEVLFMSRIFFRVGEFQNSLGTQENSHFLLPYQKYYHSVKFANNDFELELGLEHRRSVTCRFPPPQKWDGNQNGSWAAAQSDDSIWRNFPRLRIVHTVRQTQIYAHASFLRRKKGVTDSQFHAVSNHLLSSKPLVLSWENLVWELLRVFWLVRKEAGLEFFPCTWMKLMEFDSWVVHINSEKALECHFSSPQKDTALHWLEFIECNLWLWTSFW